MTGTTRQPLPLEGSLRLNPHGNGPRVRFPARPTAASLLVGRPAEAAATVLPTLFALCSRAHGLAAEWVVAAARGQRTDVTDASLGSLEGEILREHVRSVFLDWTQYVAVLDADGLAARQEALVACPLFRKSATHAESVDWVAQFVFGTPPDAWPALFADDAAVEAWCRRGATVPARWLAAVLDDARTCGRAVFPALPFDLPDGLVADLCNTLLAPQRGSAVPTAYETGCWLAMGQARHAADRLVARLREIAARTLGTAPRPRVRAMSDQPGRALILVEIARGLLLHAAQLDTSGRTLVAYAVQAPTDWNFAVNGPVAMALDAVATFADPARRNHLGRLIATAYAPCLPFEVETAAKVSDA